MSPLQAFDGRLRLLDELEAALKSSRYTEFLVATAFASSGPLKHLTTEITAFKASGGTTRALIGIDRLGTSLDALQEAMKLFNEVYIVHTTAPLTIFHPKMYIFRGKKEGRCIIGSNNLTTGGTQTNLEAAVDLRFALPSESAEFAPIIKAWTDFLPPCPLTRPLTGTLVSQLAAEKLVMPETSARSFVRPTGGARTTAAISPAAALGFDSTFPAAPRSLPRPTAARRRAAGASATARTITTATAATTPTLGARILVMQVRVHHNGEMFLSKQAVDQNPQFFDRPWTGKTAPKKAANISSEQRNPDFVVNIAVHDSTGAQIVYEQSYDLNTVYYTKKHEVRVTVSPTVKNAVQDMALLVMSANPAPGIDYDMTILNPGSAAYISYLAQCNQTMPSGGRGPGRRMGWI